MVSSYFILLQYPNSLQLPCSLVHLPTNMTSALLVATLVIYAIFIQPILYCLWKHGGPGLLGWLALQVFCAIRIVGSALQIQDEKSGTGSTSTLVIANIGLSPMILGVVGVLHEA